MGPCILIGILFFAAINAMLCVLFVIQFLFEG